jgi:hypothetical protein
MFFSDYGTNSGQTDIYGNYYKFLLFIGELGLKDSVSPMNTFSEPKQGPGGHVPAARKAGKGAATRVGW